MRIATKCTYFVCQISKELRPWSHADYSMEFESIIHLCGISCQNMCDNIKAYHITLAALLFWVRTAFFFSTIVTKTLSVILFFDILD